MNCKNDCLIMVIGIFEFFIWGRGVFVFFVMINNFILILNFDSEYVFLNICINIYNML